MTSNWRQDKRWSDRYLPHIKQILGEVLISEPPIEEDQERNTDLMVLRMDSVRVGCRVRKNEYFERYADEFTIRAGRPSRTKTELTKIIEGWGDYFMYGFASVDGDWLVAWAIGDLKVFRRWFATQLMLSHKGCLPGKKRQNGDGSSNFLAFRWDDLPPEFVISRNKG